MKVKVSCVDFVRLANSTNSQVAASNSFIDVSPALLTSDTYSHLSRRTFEEVRSNRQAQGPTRDKVTYIHYWSLDQSEINGAISSITNLVSDKRNIDPYAIINDDCLNPLVPCTVAGAFTRPRFCQSRGSEPGCQSKEGTLGLSRPHK